MKSYKNKKIYNFKRKHLRKKRQRSAIIWWRYGSAEYTKEKRKIYRNRCKVILRKKIDGMDIEFPLYKKTLWWDS